MVELVGCGDGRPKPASDGSHKRRPVQAQGAEVSARPSTRARQSDRHIAFLRAINVGGHTVKMDELRRLFERFGFSKVETFIASGNVVFETRGSAAKKLEAMIEAGLRKALGYDVATFVRTAAELAEIAAYLPFPPKDLAAAQALVVAFLTEPLDEAATRKLLALRSDIDDFHVHGRVFYWICRTKQSESTFSNVVFEKALGRRATFRSMTTVRKMAAKYAPGTT
jgi:uncharacterized protein (DUF1697 family)